MSKPNNIKKGMKISLFGFYLIGLPLFGLTLLSSTCKVSQKAGEIEYIRYVINSGRCRDYCYHEARFEPTRVIKISKPHQETDPGKADTASFSKASWDSLRNSFDLAAFAALPEKIGCPGCSDHPIRSIEISFSGTVHKVRFETTKDVEVLKGLLQIANRYNP
jgi:hypothetical protein